MLALRRLRLAAITLGFAVLSALASTPSAFAHAAFVAASPAPGGRVGTAPREVTLTFTEPLNWRLSSVEVVEAGSGRRIPTVQRARGRSRLVVIPDQTLRAGAYRVRWHTVSTLDGHALEGSFSFGVRAPAAGGGHALEQSPLARDGWLRVALRSVFYVAALLFVAALVVPRLVRGRSSWLAPDALSDHRALPAIRERERRLVGDLGWLATGTAAGATLAEAADAAGSLSPVGLRDFLLANLAGAARLAMVLLLAAAVLTRRRSPRLAAGLAVLALGAVAASGHASSASPRVLSVLNDWLHLLSGAIWLGGIGLLAIVWAAALRRGESQLRRAVARHVLAPFGRVALPAFAVVAVTGLVSLAMQLGRLSALWETPYGRLLAVKMVVVALIATASAQHALRLRPRLLGAATDTAARDERRHWRLVRSEPVLGVAVVVLVAFLATFPLPPRQLVEAGSARAAGPACDPCPLPAPADDQLAVAGGAGSQLVAAWIRRSSAAVTGVVRISDIRGRPSRVPFRLPGARSSSCGVGCVRFRADAVIDQLRVALVERGRSYATLLPTRWKADESARARELVGEAQAAMRRVRSVREVEEVSSGPGSYARTDYRLLAPDRMAFRTNGGVETVIAGDRQWFRAGRGPWRAGDYGAGLAFRTRRWFRWSTYARGVRLLGVGRRDGRRVAELALFDEGTPVWFRLTVDLATRRVLREQMTFKGHFMTARYHAFDRPLRIPLPKDRRER